MIHSQILMDILKIHRKCKCGRFLGHPPVYNDSKCGKYYNKTQSYEKNNSKSEEKSKKNLNIDTENDNKKDINQAGNSNFATTAAN